MVVRGRKQCHSFLNRPFKEQGIIMIISRTSTMRITLLTIAYVTWMASEAKAALFQAVPAESAEAQHRRDQVIEFPLSFIVSNVREDEEWCITAINGIENGENLGVAPCDFENAPDDQLFFLDKDGMIHSGENDNLCFVIQDDNIRDGQSRLQFGSCDRRLRFNTFLLNRDERSTLRLENSPLIA